MARAASVGQGGLKVHEDPELLQKNRHGNVTMEGNDLAVLQVKYIAAGRADCLSRWRQCPCRELEAALVSPVQRQLDNNDVIVDVEVKELSVHVRERGRVEVDCQADIIAIVFLRGAHIVEVTAVREQRDELGRVSFEAASAR